MREIVDNNSALFFAIHSTDCPALLIFKQCEVAKMHNKSILHFDRSNKLVTATNKKLLHIDDAELELQKRIDSFFKISGN